MTTTITAVVPTKNSARTLEACLTAIRAQRGVQVELVVVDNHSTDATPDIARRWADQTLTGGPERSAQRNLGIRAGSGEWICWIDSDMVLQPDALAAGLEAAAATGSRAVALPELTVGDGFWTACRTLERRCYVHELDLHNPRLLRRDLFDELGGFDETMSGPEDADLRLRLQRAHEPTAYVPREIVLHDEGRLTLADVWHKRVYYGQSLPQLSAKHGPAVGPHGRSLLATYWQHRQRLLRDPVHLAGLAFLRCFEAAAYLWGARHAGANQP